MKVIQMWREFDYPGQLLDCAKSVIEIVGKDNYEILCTNPKIPEELGNVKWKNFDEEYQKALSAQKNPDWWNTYCSTNYFKSDLIRLYYATCYSDLFYLDIDIALFYLPELSEKNIPYFYRNDFCMFAVNGNTRWFEELIEIVSTRLLPRPMVIFDYLLRNHDDQRERKRMNFPNDCCERINFGKRWKK
jgi:hypothetical protein